VIVYPFIAPFVSVYMYYNALEHFCQMVVCNNPILCMVICKEDLSAVHTAFDMVDCCIAELATISDAQEATARELRAFVARITSGRC